MVWRFLALINTKSGKTGFSIFSIFVIYLSLFIAKSKDYTFGIVGGYVGAICAASVMLDIYFRGYKNGAFQLLFWRAFCDLGIGLRFILIPVFNSYLCNSDNCSRDDGNEDLCGVPAALLEFFLLASEAWFLCSGVELIYSVTNPFSRFQPRLKFYHLFSWIVPLLITFIPFLVNQNQAVYGWWYVSYEIDDQAFCWLKIQSENVLGTPMTIFFFLPLQIVYVTNVLALFIAFNRLRKGLNRSFLPRLKILVSSAIHVLVLVFYWAFFFAMYGWAFSNRNNTTYNGGLFAIVNFIFASKGFSSFMIWILTTDHKNFKNFNTEDDKVEDNVALREELLSFATAGIRSTARAGPTLSRETEILIRKPQVSAGADTTALTTIVTPYFFLRFMLGEPEEIAAIETIVSSKRRSVDDNFARTTVSSTPTATIQRVSTRLSQRATIVSDRSDSTGNAGGPIVRRPFASSAIGSDSFEGEEEEEEERAGGGGGGSGGNGTESELAQIDPENSVDRRRSSDMIDASEAVSEDKRKNWLYKQLLLLRSILILDNTEHVEFYEFQPYHFRRVRMKYGITDELFISAFSTTIKERLTEGGASGAFFFYSKGEKLIAKSCTESEFNVLQSIAPHYADYIDANPRTSISKILGAYKLRIYGTSLYFFVMNNLFYNKGMMTMNEKYDIKGSWFARNAKLPVDGQSVTCSFCEQKFIFKKSKKSLRQNVESLTRSESSSTSGLSNPARSFIEGVTHTPLTELAPNDSSSPAPIPPPLSSAVSKSKLFTTSTAALRAKQCPYTVNGNHSPNLILKDNDIKYKIRLPATVAAELLRQIRLDAEFLYSMKMMDYSLLVGVHNTEYDVYEMKRMRSKSRFTTMSQSSGMASSTAQSPSFEEGGRGSSGGGNGGGGEPLRSSQKLRGSDDTDPYLDTISESSTAGTINPNKIEVMRVIGPDAYFIGIIDFQQRWTWAKKLERFIKINFHGADPKGLSAIEPLQYKDRFLRKIEDILDLEEANRLRRSTGSSNEDLQKNDTSPAGDRAIQTALEAEDQSELLSFSHRTAPRSIVSTSSTGKSSFFALEITE